MSPTLLTRPVARRVGRLVLELDPGDVDSGRQPGLLLRLHRGRKRVRISMNALGRLAKGEVELRLVRQERWTKLEAFEAKLPRGWLPEPQESIWVLRRRRGGPARIVPGRVQSVIRALPEFMVRVHTDGASRTVPLSDCRPKRPPASFEKPES